jgi:hypothetical protein
LIFVLDGSQRSGDVVDGDACGNPAPRDSYSVADEQVTVTAGDVVEVDLAIERSTDGSHG